MALTVSRRSWHYRLFRFVWRDVSEDSLNLCRYFWGLVALPFVGIVAALAAVILTPFVLLVLGLSRTPVGIQSYAKAKKARVCPVIRVAP